MTGDNPQTDSTREKDAAKKFEAAPAAENADSENHPNNADHIAATVVGTLATPESSATLEPSATIKPRSETQSADPVKDLVREEASKISSEDPDPSHAVNEPPAGNSLQPDSATSISLADLKPENWIDVYQQLPIGGLVQNTAANMVLVEVRDKLLRFELDDAQSALYDDRHQARVAEILSDYFGEDIAVDIEIGKVKAETPQAWRERIAREKRAAAIQILESDPSVQLIKQTFNAELIHHTVRSPE
ncbi:MAG: DNA polymerase III subunit gamma/tau C-terminal domain-containing protein [bacterium]